MAVTSVQTPRHPWGAGVARKRPGTDRIPPLAQTDGFPHWRATRGDARVTAYGGVSWETNSRPSMTSSPHG